MDKSSRYGKQPFAPILRSRKRSVRSTGVELGFGLHYADRVANGRVPPTDDFKQAMCDLLGLPVEDLFTSEALAATYRDFGRATGYRREGAADA